jgi:hypothetical protein
MIPETKKGLWRYCAVLSLWLVSLFIYQTIVADPRDTDHFVLWPEVFATAGAALFGLLALILHTRKSLPGLVLSLVLLAAGIACLANTQLACFFIYGDYGSPETSIEIDGVGPAEISFYDFNSDSEFYANLAIHTSDPGAIRDVRLTAAYHDLLARRIEVTAKKNSTTWAGTEPGTGVWNFRLLPCFSGKELQILITVTTTDGKFHEKIITVKVPKKPIWFLWKP